METQAQRPAPADPSLQAPRSTRNTRGPLATLTLIAFLGYDLTYFAVFLNALFGAEGFEPQILGSAILLLLLSGVVATRWRWAPLFGAVVSLVTALFVIPPAAQHLCLDSSGSARVQHHRAFDGLCAGRHGGWCGGDRRELSGEAPMKQWIIPFLSGLAGIVIGMVIVSLLAAATPQNGAASTSPNGEPAVHMTADNFAQNAVLVPLGSHLLIVADSSVEHILAYRR